MGKSKALLSIDGRFDFSELREKHSAINDLVEMFDGKLILLEPNKKSEGFTTLIDDMIILFDNPDDLSDEGLRQIFSKIYIKMKTYYPEEECFN